MMLNMIFFSFEGDVAEKQPYNYRGKLVRKIF